MTESVDNRSGRKSSVSRGTAVVPQVLLEGCLNLCDEDKMTTMRRTQKDTCLITGGSGYFGYRLACSLQARGSAVILFDVTPPPPAGGPLPDGVTFLRGDIRDYAQVRGALAGVDCVFHSASYGMSGREQLDRRRIEEVNVGGTRNVLDACVEAGVPRLVYTSTFNVVFGGQVIEGGDESLGYLPLHLHPDHYSRTKSLAEMAVMAANGAALKSGGGGGGGGVLSTCALRAAGIYGPGEQRHLPRVVGYIEGGVFRFVYGDPASRVEFVHVDNLVSAHVLAAAALAPGREPGAAAAAAGQAYFISDGRPVNNFEFFRPLVEGLGYPFPRLRLPLALVYFAAFLTEMLHRLVGPLYDFQPLLTRTEVYKTGVTHYFSLAKARAQLGYEPQEHDLAEVVQWFRSRGHGRRGPRGRGSALGRLLLNALLVCAMVALALSFLPGAGG